VAQARWAAVVADDIPTALDRASVMMRLSDDPSRLIEGLVSLFDRLDPKVLRPAFDLAREMAPASLGVAVNEALMNYRVGEVEAGRALIVHHLERTKQDPLAVEYMLYQLSRLDLWGEMAVVIGRRLEGDGITSPSLRLLGIANLEIGWKDAAFEYLDRYVDRSNDRATTSQILALELLDRGFGPEALRFAKISTEARPSRPAGQVVLGMAKLATGGAAEAESHLNRGLEGGVAQPEWLGRIGIVAARAGELEIADRYLSRLARLPSWSTSQTDAYLGLALRAYDEANAESAGVSFVEAHLPDVATMQSAALDDGGLVSQLAALYEPVDPQRAVEAYRTMVRRQTVQWPLRHGDGTSGRYLATQLNNMAYLHSTANVQVDLGVELVRTAIAAQDRRSSEFIDTLGWLYYRQGRLPEAEAEIRRSLVSTDADLPLEGLGELLHHLAAIIEAQGRQPESVWIQIAADAVDPR
jgi:tetratricopeptide (TPR) repeat protein